MGFNPLPVANGVTFTSVGDGNVGSGVVVVGAALGGANNAVCVSPLEKVATANVWITPTFNVGIVPSSPPPHALRSKPSMIRSVAISVVRDVDIRFSFPKGIESMILLHSTTA